MNIMTHSLIHCIMMIKLEIIVQLTIIMMMMIMNCCYVSSIDLNSSDYNYNYNRAGRFEAIFVFGDSIVEPGNDLMIKNAPRANYPPYGRDLPDGRPVGKYCNGLLISDFIASFAGLPYPVAYLRDKNNILKGASFASTGAVIYPNISLYKFPRLSFKDQLGLFHDAYGRLLSRLGAPQTNFIISNSLFTICIGSDDYLTNYFGNPFGVSPTQKLYSSDAFINTLLTNYKEYIMELHGFGAKKFAIFNLPPIGCTPLELLIHQKKDGTCVSEINKEIHKFNVALFDMINQLQLEIPHTHLVFFDFYQVTLDAITNPSKYGFSYSTQPCCSTGRDGGLPICSIYVSAICKNASQYIFWDFAHPTETANYLLAKAFWTGTPSYVYPITLSELASL